MKRIIFTVALAVISLAGFPATAAPPDGGYSPLDPAAAASFSYWACAEAAQRILEPSGNHPTSTTACSIEAYHGHLGDLHNVNLGWAAYTRVTGDATLTGYQTALQVALTAPGPGDGTAAAAAMRSLCERAIYDVVLSWTIFHGWYGPQAAAIATRVAATLAANTTIDGVETALAVHLSAGAWSAADAKASFATLVLFSVQYGVLDAEQEIGHVGHASALSLKLRTCVTADLLYLSFLDMLELALGSGPAPI
jgi:hypothetical protein